MSNLAMIMGMAAGGGGGIPAWAANLATGTSNRDNFSTSYQIYRTIQFNNDGTKLYGATGTQIKQYILSTAYDLSTISFDSNTNINAQSTEQYAMAFSSDGTKMYGLSQGKVVYQYTLSTAFDATTLSYDGVSFSVSSQTSDDTISIVFNYSGTKMYVSTGNPTRDVFQYSLSTAWDVSTASYDSVFFDFNGQNLYPTQCQINPAGTKFYMVVGTGSSNAYVYEYDLSTPDDLSTISYNSVSLYIMDSTNPSGGSETPYGMCFSLDGTVMVINGGTYGNLISWDLS